MHKDLLDSCLRLQLIIARLGERELMNWWNTDIAYKLGGADFLERLLGSRIAPLAAAEAVILAARLKDEELIAAMPHPEKIYSLFVPDPALDMGLKEHFRHLKRYPGDVPEELSGLLDAGKDWPPEDLQALLVPPDRELPAGQTSFGIRLQPPNGLAADKIFAGLAAGCSAAGGKNRYTLCYYEGSPHAAS